MCSTVVKPTSTVHTTHVVFIHFRRVSLLCTTMVTSSSTPPPPCMVSILYCDFGAFRPCEYLWPCRRRPPRQQRVWCLSIFGKFRLCRLPWWCHLLQRRWSIWCSFHIVTSESFASVSNRGGAGYNVASSTAHNTSGVHHVFFRKKKLKTSAGFTNVNSIGLAYFSTSASTNGVRPILERRN